MKEKILDWNFDINWLDETNWKYLKFLTSMFDLSLLITNITRITNNRNRFGFQ